MQRARFGLFVFVSSISLITSLLFGNVWFTQAQPGSTPRVWSMHPDMSMLSADTATYTVTFNQAVTGVDRNDFVVVDQTATIDSVEHMSPTELRVTVSNIASDHTPLLILVDDDTIVNHDGVPLGDIGLANGNSVSSGPAVDASVPAQSKPPTNVISLVAPRSGGINVGYDTSIKLTSAGIPVISYVDDTYKDLKITICDTVLCGSPIVKVLDSTGWVGYFSSLALTSTNIPIVSYADFTNGDLKLAICSDAACSSVTIRTVDSDGSAGGFSSIALTADNIPVISYLEEASSAIRLAVCNNTACTAPTTTVIDVTDNVGYFTSIALTSTGLPVMSYIDLDNRVVKIATCDSLTCTTPVIQTVSGTVGASRSTSLALTSDDYPIVSYYDGNNEELRVINCSTTDCSSATVTTIDTTANVGESSSIALTDDEFPVISYYDTTNTNLKLAMCTDTTCTSPSIRTIDDEGSVGLLSSVALSSTDLPIVAYYDGTNQQVKLYFDNVVVDTGAPDSVVKTSPANGAVITTTSTTLSWATVPNTNEYEYCIATSAAECTTWISTNVFGADPTSVAITDLSYNTTYYWQVRTTNAAGTTYASNNTVWSFTPIELPYDFVKSAPANTATNQPASVTLTWAASTGATSYAYCLATSAATCTTWTSTGSARTATVTGLAHNTTYYWQVRATNAAGSTVANSDTPWRFTVVLAPVTFAKSAPANNATNQKTSVALSWAASTRATSYEYCIALSTATCTTWKSTGTARTATVTGLAKNKTYYWQVRAKNSAGTTLSSTTFWQFKTAP